MEKLRRKTNLSDSFSWVFSPATKELYITSMEIEKMGESRNEDNTGDEFYSVQSFLTCCSSAATKEAFFSVEANFSRGSSLNGLDFVDEDIKRHTALQELCHCEGWPFGLCRKALFLPPLPKSPSESWSWSKWNKGTKVVKTYWCPNPVLSFIFVEAMLGVKSPTDLLQASGLIISNFHLFFTS